MYLLLTAAQLPNFVAVVSSPCCLWIFALKKKSHMSFWILPDSNQLRSPDRRKKNPAIDCISVQFSSVQSLSRVRMSVTPWIAARQASLSIANSRSSLRLMSIESVMPSSHLILRRPLLLLPPIPPASESFPMSQLFAWGGQSTGVSASASFPPRKSQGWSPSEWTGWVSLTAYVTVQIHFQENGRRSEKSTQFRA